MSPPPRERVREELRHLPGPQTRGGAFRTHNPRETNLAANLWGAAMQARPRQSASAESTTRPAVKVSRLPAARGDSDRVPRQHRASLLESELLRGAREAADRKGLSGSRSRCPGYKARKTFSCTPNASVLMLEAGADGSVGDADLPPMRVNCPPPYGRSARHSSGAGLRGFAAAVLTPLARHS
jgi:hypothetical protein